MRTMGSYAAVICALGVGLAQQSAKTTTGCAQLSNADAARLSKYVAARYFSLGTDRVSVTRQEMLSGDCHRRLLFGGFKNDVLIREVALLVSPDLRYLAREWSDSFTNPLDSDGMTIRRNAVLLSHGAPPAKGNARSTRVTVFTDFQCGYCRSLADSLRKMLDESSQPNFSVVFRHFPLSGHSWALSAAEAASCIAQQDTDAFWKFHDAIFSVQAELNASNSRAKLHELARSTRGVDLQAYRRCTDRRESRNGVEADIQLARDLEVRGTPTVFVGGYRIEQFLGAEQLQTLIRQFSGK